MADLAEILADLDAESTELDRLVTGLAPADWATATPAPGWTIAHQIAHLTWTDGAATLAATDPAGFAEHLQAISTQPLTVVDRTAEELIDEPATMLRRWRDARATLARGLTGVPAGQRLPWYGAPMSATSMATARLMETWAHGLDIAEALGVRREPTARLRHIAYLGHRTLSYSFLIHGRPAPTTPVRLALRAPDSTQWTYGPADAPEHVAGSALDFCLLVTQRRHRTDLDLIATGAVANEWLDIAQSFAGPPGAGRTPEGSGAPVPPPPPARTQATPEGRTRAQRHDDAAVAPVRGDRNGLG
jgi:uncharacterized protein (TIGR03084 family)